MRSLEQIENIKGKTVLLRVDFNLPIKDGVIEDDFRIIKTLPTINFLLEKGAKIILLTHLGQNNSGDLKSVIERFWKVSKLKKDRIEFFENVRKFAGEEKNDLVFAKKLASLGDIYVNDAFSVSHRMHASIILLPTLLPAYAGFQLLNEVKNLSRAFDKSKHPFLFILGGVKFSTKMPLIEKYLTLADQVSIGGALVDDFLKAKGFEVGKSLVDESDYNLGEMLKNEKLILPVDVIVKNTNNSAIADLLVNKKVNEIEKDEVILDIGSQSVKNLAEVIKKSQFILWNGPLGKYEAGGDGATKEILKLVMESNTESIIGGGDLVSVLSSLDPSSYNLKPNLFVSTGGGATLDFLANGTLPGIEALG